MTSPRVPATEDETYMSMAVVAAGRSKDPSTQVGAVIVTADGRSITAGYNGTPIGWSDDEFPWGREVPEGGSELDTKYPFVVHAEANAIAQFPGDRTRLQGSTLYVTHFTCTSCMKLLVQAGVTRVVYGNAHAMPDVDGDLLQPAEVIAERCGVSLEAWVGGLALPPGPGGGHAVPSVDVNRVLAEARAGVPQEPVAEEAAEAEASAPVSDSWGDAHWRAAVVAYHRATCSSRTDEPLVPDDYYVLSPEELAKAEGDVEEIASMLLDLGPMASVVDRDVVVASIAHRLLTACDPVPVGGGPLRRIERSHFVEGPDLDFGAGSREADLVKQFLRRTRAVLDQLLALNARASHEPSWVDQPASRLFTLTVLSEKRWLEGRWSSAPDVVAPLGELIAAIDSVSEPARRTALIALYGAATTVLEHDHRGSAPCDRCREALSLLAQAVEA